jgi:hypothetical protein
VIEFEEQSENDRDWLAFRYIAGELTGDEAAAFEADLETSQPAREAVARAVELSQAVAWAELHQVELAGHAGQSAGRKSLEYGLGWFAAGVTAASVAGLVWWNSQSRPDATPALADAWSKSRAVEPPLSSPEASPVEIFPLLDSGEPAIAPAWMTAGVIGQHGGVVVDDLDGDGKPDDSWQDEVMEN